MSGVNTNKNKSIRMLLLQEVLELSPDPDSVSVRCKVLQSRNRSRDRPKAHQREPVQYDRSGQFPVETGSDLVAERGWFLDKMQKQNIEAADRTSGWFWFCSHPNPDGREVLMFQTTPETSQDAFRKEAAARKYPHPSHAMRSVVVGNDVGLNSR